MSPVRKTSHVTYDVNYHFVFVPKYRKKLLKEGVRGELRSLLYKVAKEYGWWIEELEIMEDHVHILLSAPPKYSPAQIMQTAKSITAKRMFAQFPELTEELWAGEFWADGYFVSTVGDDVTKEVIRKYIQHQRQQKFQL